MNIYHIITELANGGAEKMTVELANEQVKTGHQVSIVLFEPLNENMIHYKNLDKNVKILLLKRKRKFDVILLPKLYQSIRRNNCEIIHTHKPSGILHILPLLFFLKKKIRIIHTVHNELSYYKKLFNFLNFFSVYSKRVINVCLSQKIQNEYKQAFPQLIFHSIPNGISKPLNSNEEKKVKEYISRLRNQTSKILLFIGRNSEQKNLTLLFDLMNAVKLQNIDCKLICAGIERNNILKQYGNAKTIIDDNTYVLGTKSNIADYLVNVDALILSSKNEGMPLAIIEALSYGRAIISTPVGSIPDMIEENSNGFIADEISLEGLMRALKSYMENSKENLMKISDNNIRVYEEFYSIENCTERYLKIYSK